jgi:hypothetical protein
MIVMKKTIAVITIILLLSSPTMGIYIQKETSTLKKTYFEKLNNILPPQSKIIKLIDHLAQGDDNFNDFSFSPEDIELQDDAFHGADTLHFSEWWYFDAVFNDDYSFQTSLHVLSVINQGFAYLTINLYKDNNLILNEKKLFPLSDLYLSKDAPLIMIDGKQFMMGHIDTITGDWIYDISFENDDILLDLQFIGATEGWKGTTPAGGWGVILPRAEVNGKIMVESREFELEGVGYHDHNWDVKISTALNFGWFWGKVNSNNYTITWSKIMKTWFLDKPLIVVNEKNNGYMNIEPENIIITVEDLRFKDRMLIPYAFNIDAHNEYVSLNIDIEVLETHYSSIMSMINYWRYHVNYSGLITVGLKTEVIDEKNVAEFVRFRFY